MPREYRRNKPYVEDSTKGASIADPINFKPDVLTQVWIESRVLASLSKWLDENGFDTKYISEVVRESLNFMFYKIIEMDGNYLIDDPDDARSMLEEKYRVNLNPGDRGMKNHYHNQILAERRRELRGHKIKDMEVSHEKVEDVTKPMKEKAVVPMDDGVYQMPTPKAMTMEELTGEASGTKDTSEIMPTVDYMDVKHSFGPSAEQAKAKKKDSRPRAKTNEEITADEERIAAKDKALAEADMSAPGTSE